MGKKAWVIVMVFMLVMASIVGCSGDTATQGAEITLITDKGNIDDKSFNQGAWEGVVEFATAENIPHAYIKPEDDSDAGYLASIDLAVTGGAKVVVTPGFLFEVAIYEAQTKYPDVKFILLDGAPRTADYSDFRTDDNVASIFYAEEESAYLAGYAAVMDGMTKLGYMGGMPVPAVQAFGYGFLQGAEAAANDLGLANDAIEVTYHYTGNFAETDTNKATARTMYQEGVEVIFAAGGAVGKSVMSAAAEAEGKVIGVDVDQRYDSETVITSAMKGLATSVIDVLESIYKTDSWNTYSGKSTYFNAANDGVGLPTIVIDNPDGDAFDRFETFGKADYDALFAAVAAGDLGIIREIQVADAAGNATADELVAQLGLEKVTVRIRR